MLATRLYIHQASSTVRLLFRQNLQWRRQVLVAAPAKLGLNATRSAPKNQILLPALHLHSTAQCIRGACRGAGATKNGLMQVTKLKARQGFEQEHSVSPAQPSWLMDLVSPTLHTPPCTSHTAPTTGVSQTFTWTGQGRGRAGPAQPWRPLPRALEDPGRGPRERPDSARHGAACAPLQCA